MGIQQFSFKKMLLKIPSAKWQPFCLSLNMLRDIYSSQLSVVCCLNEMWLISLTGGLVMPYGDRESEIWVNIGSDNGLLPDGAKPLPESMLTTH